LRLAGELGSCILGRWPLRPRAPATAGAVWATLADGRLVAILMVLTSLTCFIKARPHAGRTSCDGHNVRVKRWGAYTKQVIEMQGKTGVPGLLAQGFLPPAFGQQSVRNRCRQELPTGAKVPITWARRSCPVWSPQWGGYACTLRYGVGPEPCRASPLPGRKAAVTLDPRACFNARARVRYNSVSALTECQS
jgi:hypothetical protein